MRGQRRFAVRKRSSLSSQHSLPTRGFPRRSRFHAVATGGQHECEQCPHRSIPLPALSGEDALHDNDSLVSIGVRQQHGILCWTREIAVANARDQAHDHPNSQGMIACIQCLSWAVLAACATPFNDPPRPVALDPDHDSVETSSPPPTWWESLQQRDTLTGEWGGRRAELRNRGVELQVEYTLDAWGQHQGWPAPSTSYAGQPRCRAHRGRGTPGRLGRVVAQLLRPTQSRRQPQLGRWRCPGRGQHRRSRHRETVRSLGPAGLV